MNKLPRLGLSADTGVAALDQWREATAMLFAVEPVETPFRAAISSYSLGEVLFGASASVAHRFVRDPALVARSGIDHLLVQLYLEGGFEGIADRAPCVVEPGDIVLFDLARTFDTWATRFANLNLVVPRRLLPAHVRDRNLHGTVLTPQTPAGRMLAAHLRSLWSVCENAAASDAPEIVRVTVATVSAVLEDLGAEDGAASPRLHGNAEVVAYIEDNLGLRSLDADHLCERFGLSRSNLYRQFERIGGVATFIRNRRLEAAFDDLNTTPRRSGRIEAIARARGFASEDSFARAFRKRYGFSPKELGAPSGKAIFDTSGATGPTSLSAWFRAIGSRQSDQV
ncbi:AraC-like ligand-binding domain-containing protein [Tsuneonella amylolytica]|uniref:AraC-like ligand-binding domain-containing protein n=1 Tax=Tsuneonella amylolytica TaxID=2338327 RepID=UPI000EA9B904|nr:helix-turn-helix domain-containing protein [Tsuneonella amylolytica]